MNNKTYPVLCTCRECDYKECIYLTEEEMTVEMPCPQCSYEYVVKSMPTVVVGREKRRQNDYR